MLVSGSLYWNVRSVFAISHKWVTLLNTCYALIWKVWMRMTRFSRLYDITRNTPRQFYPSRRVRTAKQAKSPMTVVLNNTLSGHELCGDTIRVFIQHNCICPRQPSGRRYVERVEQMCKVNLFDMKGTASEGEEGQCCIVYKCTFPVLGDFLSCVLSPRRKGMLYSLTRIRQRD